MKTIGGKAYPGKLKYGFYTFKQMKEFLKRSKGLNKEYWTNRIKLDYGEDTYPNTAFRDFNIRNKETLIKYKLWSEK